MFAFKGGKELQDNVKACAARLGISYSDFLRSAIEEATKQLKKQFGN